MNRSLFDDVTAPEPVVSVNREWIEQAPPNERATLARKLRDLADQIDPERTDIPYDDIIQTYNAAFQKACRWTDKRQQLLRARWRNPLFRQHWKQALAIAAGLAFFRGQNGHKWTLTLEFFLRRDSVTRIIEGEFGKPHGGVKAPEQNRVSLESAGYRRA